MPPPSVRTLVLDWSVDPAMALVVGLAAGLYLLGVRRLARRRTSSRGSPAPRRWPPARTAAFAAGLLTLLVATQSGLAAYDTVLFSLHTVQHVLIGMVTPVLLALGAPITLALQASAPTTHRTLLRILHHPVMVTLTHPLVAWGVFGGTLFALYFSPLFELSLSNDLVHQAVHVHFLAAGLLFAWPAVGLDPQRHRLSHPARLLYVLLAVPFHAFLGLAVLSAAESPMGAEVYGAVARDWGPTLAADQRTGAAVLWALGDLFGLIAGAIVVTQWIKADERRQAREDRRLDEAIRASGSSAG